MVKRNVRASDQEPEQKEFLLPSEKEHLFEVVDFIDSNDADFVLPKCEVVGGDEEGRTLLNRVSLNPEWKGFFATRLFLKAISEPYKNDIEIDTERWIGRQFYATVIHNDKYANIGKYNFDKKIEQSREPNPGIKNPEPTEVAWDDDK